MKLSNTLSLLTLVGMNLSGCISGPSPSSAPAQDVGEIDQVPATAGAMPLALNGADINQSQGHVSREQKGSKHGVGVLDAPRKSAEAE